MDIPNPRVVDEMYEVQAPYIMATVWVTGEIETVIGVGTGFAKAEPHDCFDPNFGRKLSRRRALASAERDYFQKCGEFAYSVRMGQADALVNAKYPKEK